MLEIKNLNVSFKTQNVLNNLNLNIEEGIVIGILGKEWSWKNNLVRIPVSKCEIHWNY